MNPSSTLTRWAAAAIVAAYLPGVARGDCTRALDEAQLEGCVRDRPFLTGAITGGLGFDSNQGGGGGTFTGRLDITKARPLWLGMKVRMLPNSHFDAYIGWAIHHRRQSGWHVDTTAVKAGENAIWVNEHGTPLQIGGSAVVRSTTAIVAGARGINVIPTGVDTTISMQPLGQFGLQHHIVTHRRSHKIFEAYAYYSPQAGGWGGSAAIQWSTLTLGRFVAGAEAGFLPTTDDPILYFGIDFGAAFEL